MLTDEQRNDLGERWATDDLPDIDSLIAAIETLVRAECVPPGHVVVPVELLQDAISSIDDYRGGIDFGLYDRKLLGRLKSALPAAPGTTPKEPSNG